MDKDYLESLDRLYCSGNLQLDYVLSNKHKQDYELLKHAFQHLESIDNAEPSEALECLERIDNTLCLNNIKGKLEFGIDDEEHTDCDSAIGMVEDLETIKNYILKAQEQEKEKLFFKNIHNTKVKTPLVSIFNGLSKEERYKFTEHLYYNWEEMKEALEDKNNELEKENDELKKKARAFEIIKEKNVNMFGFKRDIKQLGKRFTYKYYQSNLGNYHSGFNIQELTEEEFILLKEIL